MKAKYISLGILIALVVLGVVVLFFTEIPMDRYVQLSKSVATVLIPLFISIGGNSAVEKITNSVNSKKEGGE
jgi:hypothetical protein